MAPNIWTYLFQSCRKDETLDKTKHKITHLPILLSWKKKTILWQKFMCSN